MMKKGLLELEPIIETFPENEFRSTKETSMKTEKEETFSCIIFRVILLTILVVTS